MRAASPAVSTALSQDKRTLFPSTLWTTLGFSALQSGPRRPQAAGGHVFRGRQLKSGRVGQMENTAELARWQRRKPKQTAKADAWDNVALLLIKAGVHNHRFRKFMLRTESLLVQPAIITSFLPDGYFCFVKGLCLGFRAYAVRFEALRAWAPGILKSKSRRIQKAKTGQFHVKSYETRPRTNFVIGSPRAGRTVFVWSPSIIHSSFFRMIAFMVCAQG